MQWFRAAGNYVEHYAIQDLPENLNRVFSSVHISRTSFKEPFRYIVHGKNFGGLSGELAAMSDREAKAEVLVKVEECLSLAIEELRAINSPIRLQKINANPNSPPSLDSWPDRGHLR